MSKAVNVVLNSNTRMNGSTVQNAQYFIDWKSILNPRKKYNLHFVYNSTKSVNWDGAKIPTLYANFNTNTVAPAGGNTNTSQLLGILMPTTISHGANTSVFLQALDNTNLPIYLESMPGNNMLTVSILDNAIPPLPYADPDTPTPYVLILRFTEIEEEDDM